MAEEDTKDEREEKKEEESKGRRFPKFLLIAPIILMVLTVQTACAFFLIKKVVFPRIAASASEKAKVVKKDKRTKKLPEKMGQIYIIEGIIANPKGSQGKNFLAVALGLELDPATQLEVAQEIKEKEVMLKDVISSILSSKDVVELSDVSNRNALRATLLREIRKRIVRGKVKGLYFNQYILL